MIFCVYYLIQSGDRSRYESNDVEKSIEEALNDEEELIGSEGINNNNSCSAIESPAGVIGLPVVTLSQAPAGLDNELLSSSNAIPVSVLSVEGSESEDGLHTPVAGKYLLPSRSISDNGDISSKVRKRAGQSN